LFAITPLACFTPRLSATLIAVFAESRHGFEILCGLSAESRIRKSEHKQFSTKLFFACRILVSTRRTAMNLHMTTIATVAALASGIGMAAAADNHAMSRISPPAMQSVAKDNLSLTRSQERIAWNDIKKQGTSQTSPSGFSASIGATVPDDISLKSVPSNLVSRVSALRPYDYALVQGRVLIVNPSDKKVVDVINRHA
jgi:hypothetical protein